MSRSGGGEVNELTTGASVLSSIPESAEHLAHPHDRVVDDPATSIRLDVRGGVPGTVSAGRRY